jgi:hypothetical protein
LILTISLTVFFSLPLSLFPTLILIRTLTLIPFRRYDDTVTPDSLNKQIRKLNEEVKEIDSELEALHEDRTCPHAHASLARTADHHTTKCASMRMWLLLSTMRPSAHSLSPPFVISDGVNDALAAPFPRAAQSFLFHLHVQASTRSYTHKFDVIRCNAQARARQTELVSCRLRCRGLTWPCHRTSSL